MNIILDTNFVIDCARFRLGLDEMNNIEGLYGKNYLIVLDCCCSELEALAGKKTRHGAYARLGLEILKRENVRIARYQMRSRCVDDSVLSYAKERRCAVATNDKKLITRLKKNKISVVRIRQKKGFMIE